MTARQLPERPNLEQLKRQAKDLLAAAREHDPPQLSSDSGPCRRSRPSLTPSSRGGRSRSTTRSR